MDLVAALSKAAHTPGVWLPPRPAAAIADQLDTAEEQRDLQLETRAHIRVQREIDRRFMAGTLPEPASGASIRWLHRAFYEEVREAVLTVERDGKRMSMTPGDYHSPADAMVAKGRAFDAQGSNRGDERHART